MHTNFRDIEGQIMIKTGKEAEKEIEKILLEKIELAKPDDLAFLEFQAQLIAHEIASRLGLLDGTSR